MQAVQLPSFMTWENYSVLCPSFFIYKVGMAVVCLMWLLWILKRLTIIKHPEEEMTHSKNKD